MINKPNKKIEEKIITRCLCGKCEPKDVLKSEDGKTFEHLMLVLVILLGDARECIRAEFKNEKEWEAGHKKEKELINEASKYLKTFVTSSIEQSIKEREVINDFYKAFAFLEQHSYFKYSLQGETGEKNCECFPYALDVQVVKVNPETDSIDDDENKNTEIRVWLECGDWDYDCGVATHDIKLDCGAETFEEAIIKLAGLVAKEYGSN